MSRRQRIFWTVVVVAAVPLTWAMWVAIGRPWYVFP